MKKLTLFLFFIALFSFRSFAQTDADDQTTDATTESVFTPMSSSSTLTLKRCPYCYKYHSPQCKYCSVCHCYHYPVCPTPTPTPTPHPLPFDGGLSILLVAGAAYGAKRKLTKKKTESAV